MLSIFYRAVLRRQIKAVASPFRACRTPRFVSTLAILDQEHGQLDSSYLNILGAARKLGGSVHAFIAGSDTDLAAHTAAQAKGVDKVFSVSNPVYDKGLPESYALLVIDHIHKGSYTHIVAGHTSFGKSLMPRLAALLDTQQISDVVDIQDDSTFERPIYAGNAISTVRSNEAIRLISIRPSSFAPIDAKGSSAQVIASPVPQYDSMVEWVSENLIKSDRPNLASAKKVVSGGRGLKSKANFDSIIVPLAEALGAAVGASRAAVDDGYADNSLQVGQTGKVVAPQLYLAVGISGAIQHIAGMKDSKVIAAINKNPDEPIFQVADIGLVGDLFDTVPDLSRKLKNL